MPVRVYDFYRMDFPFFHDRIGCMELQQHGSHIAECHTCLHTCILWADSVVRAWNILMAGVYQSDPPIHIQLVLVLPQVPWLSQAGGKPCAPERHLVGCGLWSHWLWVGEHQFQHWHWYNGLPWGHQTFQQLFLTWPLPKHVPSTSLL